MYLFRAMALTIACTVCRPENFKGKVLVVGLGNTGADTAVALVGHANKIYLSHRHGTTIVRTLAITDASGQRRAGETDAR